MAIRIKAAKDHRVRDEHANLLPAEGIELPKFTPYWERRRRDGEIVVEDLEAPAASSEREVH